MSQDLNLNGKLQQEGFQAWDVFDGDNFMGAIQRFCIASRNNEFLDAKIVSDKFALDGCGVELERPSNIVYVKAKDNCFYRPISVDLLNYGDGRLPMLDAMGKNEKGVDPRVRNTRNVEEGYKIWGVIPDQQLGFQLPLLAGHFGQGRFEDVRILPANLAIEGTNWKPKEPAHIAYVKLCMDFPIKQDFGPPNVVLQNTNSQKASRRNLYLLK